MSTPTSRERGPVIRKALLILVILLLAVVWALCPGGLAAQARPGADERPRMRAGLSVAVADPRGEFSEYVDVGGGVTGFFRVGIDPEGVVALRIDAGFLNYGNETKRVCLSPTIGCRIEVDLTTSNNIVLFGLGPELGLGIGSVRLYGNASVGLGYFSTDSHVEGSVGDEPFASTHNYGDGGFAWTGGGGIEIPIARAGRFPIALDFGLAYHRNGSREYLTRGGIVDEPDGSISLDVKRSEADFLLWRIGASVGIVPPESQRPE
jgi:hypothetical protein